MGCFDNVDKFNACVDTGLKKVFRLDDESLRADRAKAASAKRDAELAARISSGNVSGSAQQQPLVERLFGNGLAAQFRRDKESQSGLN